MRPRNTRGNVVGISHTVPPPLEFIQAWAERKFTNSNPSVHVNESGEIIIHTGLKMEVNGELVPIERECEHNDTRESTGYYYCLDCPHSWEIVVHDIGGEV